MSRATRFAVGLLASASMIAGLVVSQPPAPAAGGPLPSLGLESLPLPSLDLETPPLPSIGLETPPLPSIGLGSPLPSLDLESPPLPSLDLGTPLPSIDLDTPSPSTGPETPRPSSSAGGAAASPGPSGAASARGEAARGERPPVGGNAATVEDRTPPEGRPTLVHLPEPNPTIPNVGTWLVPAIGVAVPGLIALLFVAIQIVGGAAATGMAQRVIKHASSFTPAWRR